MCPLDPPAARALMTVPRVINERLIFAPSLRVDPVAPVFDALSEPAKSTKLSFALTTCSLVTPPASSVTSLCSILIVKHECDRLDRSFMFVAATRLTVFPCSRSRKRSEEFLTI
jgi:hypothetical protein